MKGSRLVLPGAATFHRSGRYSPIRRLGRPAFRAKRVQGPGPERHCWGILPSAFYSEGGIFMIR
jgi:hypothetical protein